MRKKPILAFIVLLALATLALAACSPAASSLPTPAVPVEKIGGARAVSWLVTPGPEERLRLVNFREVASQSAQPRRFTVAAKWRETGANEPPSASQIITVVDTQTGATFAVGDSVAGELLQTYDDRYVVWSQFCNPCAPGQYGLHVRSLQDGKEQFVTDVYAPGIQPKLDGDWLVYAVITDEAANAVMKTVQLRAFNLVTGEQRIVAENAYVPLPGPSNRFAAGNGRVAWIGANQPAPFTLHVTELQTGAVRTLALPDSPENPMDIALLGDLVIWLDGYWRGYDLRSDAYFSIPVLPPGWERAEFEEWKFESFDGQSLMWALKVGGQWHAFRAELSAR